MPERSAASGMTELTKEGTVEEANVVTSGKTEINESVSLIEREIVYNDIFGYCKIFTLQNR